MISTRPPGRSGTELNPWPCYSQSVSENLNYRHGRFEADEIRDGDGYELSGGYPIRCLPTGGRGSDAAATGAAVLKSDPQVDSAGVETGYSPAPEMGRRR